MPNQITGCEFMFTGRISVPRREAQDILKELGGIPGHSVCLRTTYLVVGDDPGGKLKKAAGLGVTTIPEDRFWEMVREARSTLDPQEVVDQTDQEAPGLSFPLEVTSGTTEEVPIGATMAMELRYRKHSCPVCGLSWSSPSFLPCTVCLASLGKEIKPTPPVNQARASFTSGLATAQILLLHPELLKTQGFQLGPKECTHCEAGILYTIDYPSWYCFRCGLYTQEARGNSYIPKHRTEPLDRHYCEPKYIKVDMDAELAWHVHCTKCGRRKMVLKDLDYPSEDPRFPSKEPRAPGSTRISTRSSRIYDLDRSDEVDGTAVVRGIADFVHSAEFLVQTSDVYDILPTPQGLNRGLYSRHTQGEIDDLYDRWVRIRERQAQRIARKQARGAERVPDTVCIGHPA